MGNNLMINVLPIIRGMMRLIKTVEPSMVFLMGEGMHLVMRTNRIVIFLRSHCKNTHFLMWSSGLFLYECDSVMH